LNIEQTLTKLVKGKRKFVTSRRQVLSDIVLQQTRFRMLEFSRGFRQLLHV